MGEMIARRRHDEVEITIGFKTVSLCDHRLKRSGSLFEGGARLCSVATNFTKPKSKPEETVAVRMQVVAELRCKGWRIWRKCPVPPDDRSGLSTCDETAAEAGGRCFCDVGPYRFRCYWHLRSLDHKQRR